MIPVIGWAAIYSTGAILSLSPTIYLAANSGLFSSDTIKGVLFGSSSSNVTTQVHLDTSKAVPLSSEEAAAGWTSTTAGLVPPSTKPKNYEVGSFSFSAQTLCSIPVGSVVTDSTGQYAYTGGNAYPDSTIPTLFTSDSASNWTNTGSTCNNVQGQPQYRTYVMNSPCKRGYTYNTSTKVCNISDTNPNTTMALKPSDGKCKIWRNGNLYHPNSGDPDCSDPNKLPVFSSDKGSFNIVDQDNPSYNHSVSTDSSGRTTITTQKPSAIAPDKNEQTTMVVDKDSNGNLRIAGVVTSTVNGSGSLAKDATTSSSSGKIELPSNLAKTEDINALKSEVSKITTDPGVPAPYNGDALYSKITDLKSEANISKVPSIFSFAPPMLEGQAMPAITVPLYVTTVTLHLDIWADYIRSFFGFLLYLFTPWIIFDILRGKKEAS